MTTLERLEVAFQACLMNGPAVTRTNNRFRRVNEDTPDYLNESTAGRAYVAIQRQETREDNRQSGTNQVRDPKFDFDYALEHNSNWTRLYNDAEADLR